MNRFSLLAAGLLGAANAAQAMEGFPAFHYVPFKQTRAQDEPPRRDPAERLAATLADPRIPHQEKAAALDALTYEDLRRIDSWLGRFEPEAEFHVASSLRWIADGNSYQAGTRIKAVRIWGSFGRWFKSSAAINDTIDALTMLARSRHPQDSRQAVSLSAMLALAQIGERLPFMDTRPQELVLEAALDVLQTYDGREREAGMMIIHHYMRGHGMGVIDTALNVKRRMRQEILDPLRGGIDSLYADAHLNSPAYRGYLYITLYRFSRLHHGDEQLRFDARQILRRAHESRLEREPQLRLMLERYAAP